MVDFLQLSFAGLAQGAAYGLIAVGFVVVFKVSGILNLAQGEFAILAAFIAISASESGIPLIVAALIGIAAMGLLGGLIERLAIAPTARSPVSSFVTYIILTLGIGLALRGVAQLGWGSSARSLPRFSEGLLDAGGVVVRPQQLWIIGITALVGILLYLFFDRTSLGKAFTACSEQPVAARLVGISPAAMSRLSFVLAGVLAGIAGVALSPLTATTANSGLLLALKGIVAAAVAGFVSISGAILGGLLLGGLESLAAGYISSGLKDALSLTALILLLVARPQGLFGELSVERV